MPKELQVGGQQKNWALREIGCESSISLHSFFEGVPMKKETAIAMICAAAQAYRKNFIGRRLLFIGYKSSSRKTAALEVVFHAANFLHLTGVRWQPNGDGSAKEFFNRCINHKINAKEITFAYGGITELKIRALQTLLSSQHLNANMMGSFNGAGLSLYTENLVGSENACMGFVRDQNQTYFPNTVLAGDVRQRIRDSYRVVAVYRTERNCPYFSEMVYTAKNVDWSRVIYPPQFIALPKPEGQD